jgi:hypothetical protein
VFIFEGVIFDGVIIDGVIFTVKGSTGTASNGGFRRLLSAQSLPAPDPPQQAHVSVRSLAAHLSTLLKPTYQHRLQYPTQAMEPEEDLPTTTIRYTTTPYKITPYKAIEGLPSEDLYKAEEIRIAIASAPPQYHSHTAPIPLPPLTPPRSSLCTKR